MSWEAMGVSKWPGRFYHGSRFSELSSAKSPSRGIIFINLFRVDHG